MQSEDSSARYCWPCRQRKGPQPRTGGPLDWKVKGVAHSPRAPRTQFRLLTSRTVRGQTCVALATAFIDPARQPQEAHRPRGGGGVGPRLPLHGRWSPASFRQRLPGSAGLFAKTAGCCARAGGCGGAGGRQGSWKRGGGEGAAATIQAEAQVVQSEVGRELATGGQTRCVSHLLS